MAFANGFYSREVGPLVGSGQEDLKGRKKGWESGSCRKIGVQVNVQCRYLLVCRDATKLRSHFSDVDLFRSRHASIQGWVFWFCSISSYCTLVSRGAFVTGAG